MSHFEKFEPHSHIVNIRLTHKFFVNFDVAMILYGSKNHFRTDIFQTETLLKYQEKQQRIFITVYSGMEKKVYHLFVYGSLMSGFKSTAYEYMSRYFNLIAPAKIRGKLYDMGEYPAAIPVSEDVFIKGELYSIKNEPEFSYAMGQLDDYEGTTSEPGEPQLYRREITEVMHDDAITLAWVYWYNGDVSGKPVVASGDILQYHQQKNN